jgi:hypothetical protein
MSRHNTAELLQFEMEAHDGLFVRFRDIVGTAGRCADVMQWS